MDTKQLKQACKLKAAALLPKILKRPDHDVQGRQNEIAMGLKEFFDNPLIEVELHNEQVALTESKREEKKAKVIAKFKPTKEEIQAEVGIIVDEPNKVTEPEPNAETARSQKPKKRKKALAK